MTTWTAPVRYAEVDGQQIVFNAHYLLYCDEAATFYFLERDLREVALNIRLVTTELTWSGSARWGDTIEVAVSCAEIGRTSLKLQFVITASGRDCCRVRTTYVLTDADAKPTPVPDATRALLQH